MKCEGTLLLPLNLHLLFCLALAEDFTDRVVAVSDSDILVAPLAVANLTLDTPPRTAWPFGYLIACSSLRRYVRRYE